MPPAKTGGLLRFMREIEADLDGLARSRKGFLAQLAGYVLTGSGKRVRPGLVYMASQFGRAEPDQVKETAVAVELIHIATLIHDDMVDEAAMRRGKPTVAVKFGEGAAVLLGDYVYARAFERLAALNRPGLLRLFADTTMIMCEGEIGQLERRYFFDLSVDEYLSFLDKKTASLMAASVRAGGALAGLKAEELDALEIFGRNLGIAFQIVDDILDIEGEEAVTGKTLHTDLTHGKMTLPLIYLNQAMGSRERAALFKELKSPNGNLGRLIRQVKESQAISESRKKALHLIEAAEDALDRLPDIPARRLLLEISRGLSQRKN